MVPRLGVERRRRWAIPFSRLPMARGAELSIELFPFLNICCVGPEDRATYYRAEHYQGHRKTMCRLHCYAPPLVEPSRTHPSVITTHSPREDGSSCWGNQERGASNLRYQNNVCCYPITWPNYNRLTLALSRVWHAQASTTEGGNL
jgi:hypothetical protein